MDYHIINNIKSPADIKNMSVETLHEVASEMRDAVLYRCSEIGGHVSPNLGDIETVIAMHKVFNAPIDKIILDVSHQDFPHKMITGRVNGFINKDDFDKVGEYTDPTESPEYDLFYAGHTSPSITLACGMAKARDLAGDKYNVVALIGDGSLSGGQAFEGLNVAGAMKSNLIIIVNDNQMAIAETNGGMYENLRQLRESNGTADCNLFKAMGLDYKYVADGNNLEDILNALEEVKDIDHPVVVHVNTQKGEGYVPAEKDREAFHYRNPFEIATGELKHISDSGTSEYLSALNQFLMDKGTTDANCLIISSATPETFGLLAPERKLLGKHYLDPGIAEQGAVSVMAGAARGGAKVIYPVMGTFLQRAYDQLLEDWAMDNSPALMPVCEAGVNGIPDKTHLGFWDIPMLTSIPEIIYLAPTNIEEMQAMLEWGYSQTEYKVAVRIPTYSLQHAKEAPDTDYSDINKFKITHEGKEVAIIGAGDFYSKAEEVAEILKASGIDATLINPRFISGVDEELIRELKSTHRVIATLEDGSLEGGFAQRVAAAAGPLGMKALSFGLPKKFQDHYSVALLEENCGLEPRQIADKILTSLQE